MKQPRAGMQGELRDQQVAWNPLKWSGGLGDRDFDYLFAVDELVVELGQHLAQLSRVEGLEILAVDQLGENVPHFIILLDSDSL
jgi:hypothetical protein